MRQSDFGVALFSTAGCAPRENSPALTTGVAGLIPEPSGQPPLSFGYRRFVTDGGNRQFKEEKPLADRSQTLPVDGGNPQSRC